MASDHVRLLVEPYRSDRTDLGQLTAAFAALHALLGARRTLALEVHLDRSRGRLAARVVRRRCARRGSSARSRPSCAARYPNARLRAVRAPAGERPARRPPRATLAASRARRNPRRRARRREPLLRAMAAAGPPATVRLMLRPAPASRRVAASRPRCNRSVRCCGRRRSVLAADVARARAIASVLAAGPPRLVASRLRGAGTLRRSPRRLFRPWELARLWSLPSPEFAGVPVRAPLRSAGAGAARRTAGARRAGRAAPRRARAGDDPRDDAPPARRGRRRRRPGEDLVPRREHARGPAACRTAP